MSNLDYPAEFVFPGHPDKLSDAIADALVQEASQYDKRALVGVEVAVHRNKVFITGRIGCEGAESIDIDGLTREVYRTAGHDDGWNPGPDEIVIETDLCLGPLEEGEAEYRSVSDDQSICSGYAIAIPETNYLPVEHWLVNRLGRRLMSLRLEYPTLSLGPDGKAVVIVHETDDGNRTLSMFSCSIQQREEADDIALHRAVRIALEAEMKKLADELPGLSPGLPEELFVNGAGSFDVGGPEGDNGLSGKKLVIDAYGPRVQIGGGALSGKDFFKVDRAGALHARRIAKAVVLTGTTREALVRLAWFPGDQQGRLLSIETEDRTPLNPKPWQRLFDLSLEASGENWAYAADLVQIARYGHFTDKDLLWESLQFNCGTS